ncbi:MAG: hypothetical protein RMJ44_07060 [Cytophagales bacterium]|nr:hypothetical protein [Bernardetiaceae bacterium]MDW8210832.1 hypothetical protein [Cytophagales bacterium]
MIQTASKNVAFSTSALKVVLSLLVAIVCLGIAAALYWSFVLSKPLTSSPKNTARTTDDEEVTKMVLYSNLTRWQAEWAVRKVNINYGEQVDKLAAMMDLPANYIKALILLECSGNLPAASRFEPEVLRKLIAVQQGKLPAYNGICQNDLEGKSLRELKEMATSWGPLQIMGYHALRLGIKIEELYGDNSLFYGMVWVKNNYGHLLARKAYYHAFHFHNTGRLYPFNSPPLTYDPYYVGNGLYYMLILGDQSLLSMHSLDTP